MTWLGIWKNAVPPQIMNGARRLTRLVMVGVVALTANAQDQSVLVVEQIRVGGVRVNPTVSIDVRIIASGKTYVEEDKLTEQQAIPDGTELHLPGKTEVVLRSCNGNLITLDPGTIVRLHCATGKGETYAILNGRVSFLVVRALNFFNVHYHRFLAAVLGTKFSIEVQGDKVICCEVAEGEVQLKRLKVNLAPEDGDRGFIETRNFRPGDKPKTFRLAPDDYLKHFETYKDAESAFRAQLAEDEASGNADRIERGLLELGIILEALGKAEQSIEYYERALEIARTRGHLKQRIWLLNNLGSAHQELGHWDQALAYHQQTLQLRLNRSPADAEVADSFNNIGNVYYGKGNYALAIEYHEEALKRRRDVAGIARSHNNLGAAYREQGQPRKAIEHHQKALEIRKQMYRSETNALVANSYQNLALAYHDLANSCQDRSAFAKAGENHEKALAMRLRLFPDLHPSIAESYNALGSLHYDQKDFVHAKVDHLKALDVARKFFPDGNHPLVAGIYNNLGNDYHGSGEDEYAMENYQRALELRLQLFSAADHKEIADSYSGLGESYDVLGDQVKATENHEKALAIRLKAFPNHVHPAIAESYRNLATVWRHRSDEERAAFYDNLAQGVEAEVRSLFRCTP
jgi:tetratricopeptide (TPR) repeat protein